MHKQHTSIIMSDPEVKKKIIVFLRKESPKDFNIQEIAGEIKMHRNSVSTYVKVLVAEKKIFISRTIGKINLYSIPKSK